MARKKNTNPPTQYSVITESGAKPIRPKTGWSAPAQEETAPPKPPVSVEGRFPSSDITPPDQRTPLLQHSRAVPMPITVGHSAVAAELAKQLDLVGSTMNPVSASVSTPKDPNTGKIRTVRFGEGLRQGEGPDSPAAKALRSLHGVATPAGLTGKGGIGSTGVFRGDEQGAYAAGLRERTDEVTRGMIREIPSGSPPKRSKNKMPHMPLGSSIPDDPAATARRAETKSYRAPRTMTMPSGATIPSAINLVSGRGPVEADKQLVAEGKEEMRQKEITNRARRKDTGAKKSAPLRDRQQKQMKSAAKQRGPGPY